MDSRRVLTMADQNPWPAREDLPPPPPTESEERERALAGGLGAVGFACSMIGLVGFLIPFLDLLFAIGGMVYSGRALYLARDENRLAPKGIPFALAGLVIGIIALAPGVLITYDTAFRH